MKNNIPCLLSLFLCTSSLHTTEAEVKKVFAQNTPQTKVYAPWLQSSLINSAVKNKFRLNAKALPLTLVTVVYGIHGLGIGNALISQPVGLLGAIFFGTVLLYPQPTKDLCAKAVYHCSKGFKPDTYRLTQSYLRFRGFSQN